MRACDSGDVFGEPPPTVRAGVIVQANVSACSPSRTDPLKGARNIEAAWCK